MDAGKNNMGWLVCIYLNPLKTGVASFVASIVSLNQVGGLN